MPYTGNIPKDIDPTLPANGVSAPSDINDAIRELSRNIVYLYTAATVTGMYSISATDSIIWVTSGTFAVTLPALSSVATATVVNIKRLINTGTGVLTIVPTGADTIVGATTLLANESAEAIGIGTTWFIVKRANTLAADKLVVSTNDTTPGYLSDKITVSGLTKSIANPGANERLLISCPGWRMVGSYQLTGNQFDINIAGLAEAGTHFRVVGYTKANDTTIVYPIFEVLNNSAQVASVAASQSLDISAAGVISATTPTSLQMTGGATTTGGVCLVDFEFWVQLDGTYDVHYRWKGFNPNASGGAAKSRRASGFGNFATHIPPETIRIKTNTVPDGGFTGLLTVYEGRAS